MFGRIIPKLEVEALTWTLSLATDRPLPKPATEAKAAGAPKANGHREVLDPASGRHEKAAIHERTSLSAGMSLDVYVHDDRVTIDVGGADQVWCLKRHIELPIAHITSARVADVGEVKDGLGFRVGGGYWPGRMATGHFTVPGRKGARQFWCVYRDREVLVIDTDLDSPSRVVLQHPDRDRLAWLISERIPAHT